MSWFRCLPEKICHISKRINHFVTSWAKSTMICNFHSRGLFHSLRHSECSLSKKGNLNNEACNFYIPLNLDNSQPNIYPRTSNSNSCLFDLSNKSCIIIHRMSNNHFNIDCNPRNLNPNRILNFFCKAHHPVGIVRPAWNRLSKTESK